MFRREQCQLEPIAHETSLVDRGQDVLDRLFAEMQFARDLAVGPSGGDGADDITLTRCQHDSMCAVHLAAASISFDGRMPADSGVVRDDIASVGQTFNDGSSCSWGPSRVRSN